MNSNHLMELALQHAAAGRPVFPLHYPLPDGGGCTCSRGSQCPNPGKHPRLKGWQDAATTDPEMIRAWWTERPRSNIGMPTGAAAGISILDVDPRHGGDETLRELETRHGALPDTVESLTGGGGRQLWFRHEEGLRNSVGQTNPLGAGLDVRGEGGLVVLPGSLHPSGRTYAWDLSRHPDETPAAAFPEWLLELLLRPAETRTPAAPVIEKIASGGRNDTLTSIAGTIRRRGLDSEEILAALLVVNRHRCDPPLPEEEVRQIAESIGRYAPEQTHTLRIVESKRTQIIDEELSIIPLRVSRGIPPIYTARVRGRDLRLTAEDLMNFRRFKQRCMEVLDFIPEPPVRFDDDGKRKPAGAAWEELVNEALAGVEAEDAPPDDASPAGAVWDAICEYIGSRKISEERDRILSGAVVLETDYYLFRGADLRRHLKLTGADLVGEHQLWLIIRDHGGQNGLIKAKRRPVRVWKLPIAAVRAEAEEDEKEAGEEQTFMGLLH